MGYFFKLYIQNSENWIKYSLTEIILMCDFDNAK